MTTAYARALGPRMSGLAPELRALHGGHGRFEGRITVTLPRNPLLRLMARLAGFPPAADAVPFVFATEPDGVRDVWTRKIGSHTMTSRLWVTPQGLLAERMGAVTAVSELEVTPEAGLSLRLGAFRVLGCPLPLIIAPRIAATERGEDGRYLFDVEVRLPILKTTLVNYAGFLSI